MKRLDIFRNEHGAVDLGSIMVGVIVIGLIGGVIAATVFAVIPWVQNTAAKHALQSVATAQGAYKASTNTYGSMKDLAKNNFIEHDGTNLHEEVSSDGSVCARVTADGGYIASSKSATGEFFNISDTSNKPLKVKEHRTCFGENYEPYSMVFTIDTTHPNCSTYLFPAKQLQNVSINWGDSSPVEQVTTDYPTHPYPVKGSYTVKVTGKFKEYGNFDKSNSQCITAVKKWEGSGTERLTYAFRGTTKLKEVVEIPSTAGYIANMFMESTFNGDISDWNTSNVWNMQYMFQSNLSFNQDISNWDMSNVNNISGMFSNARAFNQPIGKWNVSKVTTLSNTFNNAVSFNQDISQWDISHVISLENTFNSTEAFNVDISGWNTSNVISMEKTFYAAKGFTQNISKWDVSKVTNNNEFRHDSSLKAENSPFK